MDLQAPLCGKLAARSEHSRERQHQTAGMFTPPPPLRNTPSSSAENVSCDGFFARASGPGRLAPTFPVCFRLLAQTWDCTGRPQPGVCLKHSLSSHVHVSRPASHTRSHVCSRQKREVCLCIQKHGQKQQKLTVQTIPSIPPRSRGN